MSLSRGLIVALEYHTHILAFICHDCNDPEVILYDHTCHKGSYEDGSKEPVTYQENAGMKGLSINCIHGKCIKYYL